jgi:hypothetical protein
MYYLKYKRHFGDNDVCYIFNIKLIITVLNYCINLFAGLTGINNQVTTSKIRASLVLNNLVKSCTECCSLNTPIKRNFISIVNWWVISFQLPKLASVKELTVFSNYCVNPSNQPSALSPFLVNALVVPPVVR